MLFHPTRCHIFANTVQPHWTQDQTPCRNGQLCQWDLTNISNIFIVVTFDLWTPRVWSRNRFFSEPQLLVAIDFTDGATLFVKLVYYCYTDSILLEWVEVNQRHKRWWNRCNLGKKTQSMDEWKVTFWACCFCSTKSVAWQKITVRSLTETFWAQDWNVDSRIDAKKNIS